MISPTMILPDVVETDDSLLEEIARLKQRRRAVILAHNYQIPEIQDLADYVGDSLGLARQAAETDAETIVFCGVHFMAETAKILNPKKMVLLPDAAAGCSLEESCPAEELRAMQASNPNFYTIAYVNCSAEVKALSDIICTSGNAIRVVENAPADRDLLFVPDENLGEWVMKQTGRPMTLWKGNCYAHVEFRRGELEALQAEFPDAETIVHPESLAEVRDLADVVCSTEKMIDHCRHSKAPCFLVVTESGIIHRMRRECPGKKFICAPTFNYSRLPTDGCRCSECRYMKMNTVEKLRDCLANGYPEVRIPEDIRIEALAPIQRMLALF